MGINDRCAVGTCKNAQKYKEKYVIKPHISAYNNSLELKFWRCSDPKLYPKWTTACNRKNFKFGKNNFICSNHFKYGKPTLVSPNPTLFLKGYMETSTPTKRKAPTTRRDFVTPTLKHQKSEISQDKNKELGFMVLFDKGFNVQDLFLQKQVKWELPPFLRSKRKFT